MILYEENSDMNEIKWNNLKRIYVFLRYDIELVE